MSQPLEVSDPAEGSVNWRAAREHMLGKHAAEEAAEAGSDESNAGTPDVKEFKYRGKTVRVDADTYTLLEDLKRDARGQNGRLGSELSRLRERLVQIEAGQQRPARRPEEEAPLTPPDPVLATKDIAAWQREYDAYHTAKTARQMRELEEKHFSFVREVQERTQASQREREWADGFYRNYDHLDHPEIKPIVAQAYTEHKEEIDALGHDPDAAYERLAELADARLVRLRSAGRDADPNPTTNRRPPRVESSAGPTPRARTEAPPREFSAASWAAKQRQKFAGREPKSKD